MPTGATPKEVQKTLSFNETLAREVAEKAKEEDQKRLLFVKERRDDMRDAFATQRVQRAQESDAGKRRHEADLQRFQDLRAKDAALKQQEERKEQARVAAGEEVDRKESRRGVVELEGTLRRLGVDSGGEA